MLCSWRFWTFDFALDLGSWFLTRRHECEIYRYRAFSVNPRDIMGEFEVCVCVCQNDRQSTSKVVDIRHARRIPITQAEEMPCRSRCCCLVSMYPLLGRTEPVRLFLVGERCSDGDEDRA